MEGRGAVDPGLAQTVLSDAARAKIIAHPAFPQTALALMVGWAPRADEPRGLTRLVRDMGQFVCALWAIEMHSAGEGLTHASLTRRLQALGVASGARVHAILVYLRFCGLIEPAPARDGRLKAFRPTAGLMEMMRQRFGRELAAAIPVAPQLARVIDRWNEPSVADAVLIAHGRLLASSLAIRDRGQTNLDVFSNRNGGVTILGQMLRAACPDGRLPPSGTAKLSLSELARGAGESRSHVRSILAAAQAAGLIATDADGATRFSEELIFQVEVLTSAYFAGLIWCAEQVPPA